MKISYRIFIVMFCLLISGVKVLANNNMTVRHNRTFQIKLDSNPTTGYSWYLAKPLDNAYLRLVKSSYKQDRCNSRMVGVGGVETFILKPLKKGSTTVYFEYKRPWEKEKALNNRDINILIK